MRNNVNKTNKTVEWVIASVIGIALIFGILVFRDDINMRSEDWDAQRKEWNEDYCGRAEADASNITVEIAAFFADHEHTTLPTINGDSVVLGWALSGISGKGQNIAWVTEDPRYTVTIVVQDGSGKCPDYYQERFPEWDSGRYTITKLY